MEIRLTRHAGLTRGFTLLLVALACLEFGACSGPTSPSAVVRAGIFLPEALAGVWHGVSARQTFGPAGGWNLDDMLLRTDGSAEITEYEGSRRQFMVTWSLQGKDFVTVNSPSCVRSGTVTGNTMNMTCTTGTRTWNLEFTKQ